MVGFPPGRASFHARFGRVGRGVFWNVSPASLVVAVLRQELGDPVLECCAAVDFRWAGGPGAAPSCGFGLAELAGELGITGSPHFVALDSPYARLRHESGEAVDASHVLLPVRGRPSMLCEVDVAAPRQLRARFAAARLSLRAIDSAECGRETLAVFLGAVSPRGADPLAAVCVEPEAEAAARELSGRLAAPLGLALGAMGFAAVESTFRDRS